MPKSGFPMRMNRLINAAAEKAFLFPERRKRGGYHRQHRGRFGAVLRHALRVSSHPLFIGARIMSHLFCISISKCLAASLSDVAKFIYKTDHRDRIYLSGRLDAQCQRFFYFWNRPDRSPISIEVCHKCRSHRSPMMNLSATMGEGSKSRFQSNWKAADAIGKYTNDSLTRRHCASRDAAVQHERRRGKLGARLPRMQMPAGSGECTLQMRNGRTRLSNRAENTNISTNGGLPRSRFSEPDDARVRARARGSPFRCLTRYCVSLYRVLRSALRE